MKVAVGLSGGVDSSVAAALLKESGHEVIALFMKLWDDTAPAAGGRSACCGPGAASGIEAACSVSRQLAIPFHVVDLAAEYRAEVLDYFRREYPTGRTPNPCIRCNQKIKFGALITRALQSGLEFDCFATGHYVRSQYCGRSRGFLLQKGRDARKDQSYWLAFLDQYQLARVVFPLGDYTKTAVREKARACGLITSDKRDSQDFFAGDYSLLIDAEAQTGPIVDRLGNILGSHTGIWSYTIGQRKGLGIAARQPLYVIDFDLSRNAVVVGPAEELMRGGLVASQLNLIACELTDQPREVAVKIRSAQEVFPGTLTRLNDDTVSVRFARPRAAITPGQAAVFYEGDRVLGAALIDRAVD